METGLVLGADELDLANVLLPLLPLLPLLLGHPPPAPLSCLLTSPAALGV